MAIVKTFSCCLEGRSFYIFDMRQDVNNTTQRDQILVTIQQGDINTLHKSARDPYLRTNTYSCGKSHR